MTGPAEFAFHFTASGHHCAGDVQDLSDDNFHASIERIAELSRGPGSPPAWAHDLLHVGRAVYLADKMALRDRAADRWTRTIRLRIQIIDHLAWQSCREQVELLLRQLTGDLWQVLPEAGARFHDGGRTPLHSHQHAQEVMLFSGGLDSTSYLATRLRQAPDALLVTYAEQKLKAQQEHILRALAGPAAPTPMTISPNPRRPAVTGRQSYEPSARSRGLLFTTTAIFAAAAHGVAEVSVPENGQLALNPPLTASRAGACSTRSVHPQTLHLLNALIEGIGGNVRVTNPFEHRTKGEVCAAALEAGLEEAVLWETVSCGHPPNQRGNGTQANCGYCFPCLIRRSGLRQATGHDQTPYDSGPDAWLSDKHGQDFRAVWQWLQRPFTRRDLVADCALPNMSAGHLVGWVNTIRRGRHELAAMLQELLPDPEYVKNARLQI